MTAGALTGEGLILAFAFAAICACLFPRCGDGSADPDQLSWDLNTSAIDLERRVVWPLQLLNTDSGYPVS